MFGIFNSGKSVMIREEKRFCRSPQFGLNFPKKLSGIIHPDEFEQSITNINQACRPTLYEKILILSLYLCALIGLIVFISGISVIWLSISALWIPLMSIGFAIFMSFFTIAIFVSSRVYRSCDTRLDTAVDTESRKYSKGRPVPTRWRLDMTIYARRFSTAAPTDIQYFLSIDIGQKPDFDVGRKISDVNLNSSESASDVDQQLPTAPLSNSSSSIRKSSSKALQLEEEARIHSMA